MDVVKTIVAILIFGGLIIIGLLSGLISYLINGEKVLARRESEEGA